VSYVGGVKPCACELYTEDLLIRQADNRVPVVFGDQQARDRRVRDLAEHLRENHECDHSGMWRHSEIPNRNQQCEGLCNSLLVRMQRFS
jgi:hypothetical protein